MRTTTSDSEAARPGDQADEILCVDETLMLNLTTGEARNGERSDRLTPTQRRLLASFLRAPDRVLTYQELLQEHWQGVTTMNSLYHRIVELRRALGPQLLHTVVDVGYQLNVADRDWDPKRVSLQSGDLQLDVTARQLHHLGSGTVSLGPNERSMVAFLMHRVGRIATHEELARVGGTASVDAVIDAMGRLRRKLAKIGARHLLVRAARGYRLVGRSGLRRVAGLELDARAGALRMHGRAIEPWPSWIALLELLTAAPGTTVSSDELLAHTWPTGASVEQLHPAISELRRALGPTGAMLIVANGDGYRLAVERFGLLATRSLVLDRASGCVRFDDREEQLSATQSAALELLMRNAGKMLARAWIVAELDLVSVDALRLCLAGMRVNLRRLVPSAADAGSILVARRGTWRLALEHLDVAPIDRRLHFADVQLDLVGPRLWCGDRPYAIGHAPSLMLAHLILNGGDSSYDAVVDAVWGDADTSGSTVRNCRLSLQDALDKAGATLEVQRERAGDEFRLVARHD